MTDERLEQIREFLKGVPAIMPGVERRMQAAWVMPELFAEVDQLRKQLEPLRKTLARVRKWAEEAEAHTHYGYGEYWAGRQDAGRAVLTR